MLGLYHQSSLLSVDQGASPTLIAWTIPPLLHEACKSKCGVHHFQVIRNKCDRTRSNGFKAKVGKFRLEIQNKNNFVVIEEACALQCDREKGRIISSPYSLFFKTALIPRTTWQLQAVLA